MPRKICKPAKSSAKLEISKADSHLLRIILGVSDELSFLVILLSDQIALEPVDFTTFAFSQFLLPKNFLKNPSLLEPVLKLPALIRELFWTDNELKFSPDTLLSGKILEKLDAPKEPRSEAGSCSSTGVVLRQALSRS